LRQGSETISRSHPGFFVSASTPKLQHINQWSAK